MTKAQCQFGRIFARKRVLPPPLETSAFGTRFARGRSEVMNMLRTGSFKFADLFGIEFRLHWSFPVLAAFVGLSAGPTGLLMLLAELS